MVEPVAPPSQRPCVESLRVRNFRTLQDFELRDITPFTVFVGPNGSGKSTVHEVFAFLHEAFTTSLRAAVESRYGIRELRTRGEDGPIEIGIEVSFPDTDSLLRYEIAIDEEDGRLVILSERASGLRMEGDAIDVPIANVNRGKGWVWESGGRQEPVSFLAPDDLGAPLFGRIGSNGWFNELNAFVSDWYLSDLDATDVRRIPQAGPQQRLTRTGDNVANVLEWLAERHPESLATIEARLRKWVPRLESLEPVPTGDGRSMLQLKDAPFARGIPASATSTGTLRLLAYLTALHGPVPPALMGFEEPEANLPPQLLYDLGEAFRIASARSQVFVNTHSSILLDALRPEEVRVLYRNQEGFTQGVTVSDMMGVPQMLGAGAALGALWQEGYFSVGNPLRNAGMPGITEAR